MGVVYESEFQSLVNITSTDDWAHVQRLCREYLLSDDLQRLRHLLESACHSVFIEYEYVDADYRDTFSRFYSKKFATYPDKAIRLLFFADEITRSNIWDIDSYSKSLIGYSVIRPTRIRSLGKTLLDPSRCNAVKGYMAVTQYKVHFLGRQLEVSGFPFISQDSDVTICAHAACWMCFRYFSERYHFYKEIHPYQITQLTSDISHGRLVPSSGLTIAQITEMFTRQGFYPVVYDKKVWGHRLSHLLYYYIESGLPPVIGLPGHAVTAFGHYSDFKKHVCPELTFSWHYMDGIIVNDDNLPPYKTIPIEESSSQRSLYHLNEISCFVVPLYEKMYLLAEHVEKLTLACLKDKQIGLSQLSPDIPIDKLVLRLFLTSSNSFKLHSRGRLPDKIGELYMRIPMPKFIWITELSTHELYCQQKILGELIFDATASHKDRFSFLSIHYPSVLILNDRDSMSPDPEKRLSFSHLENPQPYPVYINNLKEVK